MPEKDNNSEAFTGAGEWSPDVGRKACSQVGILADAHLDSQQKATAPGQRLESNTCLFSCRHTSSLSESLRVGIAIHVP